MLHKSVLLFVFALFLLTPLVTEAGEGGIEYTPQSVKAALDQGCSVLLEFSADW